MSAILTDDDLRILRRLIDIEQERDQLRARVDAALAARASQQSGRQELLDVARERFFAARRAVRSGTATAEQQRLVDDAVARQATRQLQRGRLAAMSMTASSREVTQHAVRAGVNDLRNVTCW